MLLDVTRCGLDAPSLHRDTSMDKYITSNLIFSRVIETSLFLNKRKFRKKMASIVPYSFKFPKANAQQNATHKLCDPGQAMAQAFAAALTPSKPSYNPPEIQLSKDAQRERDIQNNISPIPLFGVEDDRPQTSGELNAKLHPQLISEPLFNNDNCEIRCTNGEDVVGFNFQEMPVNGMPDFKM